MQVSQLRLQGALFPFPLGFLFEKNTGAGVRCMVAGGRTQGVDQMEDRDQNPRGTRSRRRK